MNKIFDTHAHLYWYKTDKENEEFIKEGLDNTTAKILCVGLNDLSNQWALDMKKQYPGKVLAAAGLYPSTSRGNPVPDWIFRPEMSYHPNSWQEGWTDLEKRLESGEYDAVGEVGLDDVYDKFSMEDQIENFIVHLKLSKKYNLPMSLHNRGNVHKKMYELIKEYNAQTPVIFHSFSGNVEDAKLLMTLDNVYFSVSGQSTHDGFDQTREALKLMPSSKLLLETDGPGLPPLPFVGFSKLSHIQLTAKYLAEWRNMDIEDLITICNQNAETIFCK